MKRTELAPKCWSSNHCTLWGKRRQSGVPSGHSKRSASLCALQRRAWESPCGTSTEGSRLASRDFPGRTPSCLFCHDAARVSANCNQAGLDRGNCPLPCSFLLEPKDCKRQNAQLVFSWEPSSPFGNAGGSGPVQKFSSEVH